MVSYLKLKKDFLRKSDAKTVELGNKVISGLTDNQFFGDISPQLNKFKAPFYDYVNSIPSKSERNSINTEAKNQKKKAALKEMLLLALFVEYKSEFNMEALISSNFEVIGKSQPKGRVGMPEDIVIKTGDRPGDVVVSCKRDPNAKMYKARASTDNKTWEWKDSHTNRSVLLKGLPLGKMIYVQMRAQNSHGDGPWSHPITGIVPDPNVIGD